MLLLGGPIVEDHYIWLYEGVGSQYRNCQGEIRAVFSAVIIDVGGDVWFLNSVVRNVREWYAFSPLRRTLFYTTYQR